MARIDPEPAVGELESLAQYLDVQRAAVLRKLDGVDQVGLSVRIPPSSLTLAGLVNHLALVEDSWLTERFAGGEEQPEFAAVDWEADPDYEFRTALELTPFELTQRYNDACARSRAVVAEASGLDQLSAVPLRNGQQFSLRWVMLHLIEETARHAGHADFLREAVDGVTGE